MAESGKRENSAPTSTVERRRETRWPTDEVAAVVRLNSGQVVEGRLVDVSGAGLRVRVRVEFAEREPVRVEFREKVWFGEVRWQRAQGDDGLSEAGIAVSVRA